MNTTKRFPLGAIVGGVMGGLVGGLFLTTTTPFGPYVIIDLVFAASCIGFGSTVGVILGRIAGNSGGQTLGPPDIVFLTDTRPEDVRRPKRPASPAYLGTLAGVFGAGVFPGTYFFSGEWAVTVILTAGAFGMAAGGAADLLRRASAARPSGRPAGVFGAGNGTALAWSTGRRQGLPGPMAVGILLGTLAASISPSLVPTEEGLLLQILAGAALGMAGGFVWKTTYAAALDRTLSAQTDDGPARGGRSSAA